jgi:hypothetical protein
MTARFRIERTYVLSSRLLYVIEGTIIEGVLFPGMLISIGFNDCFSMEFPIYGVEFVRRANAELVALTVLCEDAEEVYFLEGLWLSNDEVLISNSTDILP